MCVHLFDHFRPVCSYYFPAFASRLKKRTITFKKRGAFVCLIGDELFILKNVGKMCHDTDNHSISYFARFVNIFSHFPLLVRNHMFDVKRSKKQNNETMKMCNHGR